MRAVGFSSELGGLVDVRVWFLLGVRCYLCFGSVYFSADRMALIKERGWRLEYGWMGEDASIFVVGFT